MRPKVFLFGIDGGVPELVFEKWRDCLPNISKLMAKGCYGKLNSTIPPVTIIAWNAMFSGKDPSEIGVFSYTYQDAEGKSKLVSSKNKKVPAVWDHLGAVDKQSIVLYVPLTYPVTPIRGHMISGFMTPGIESQCVYPEALRNKIKAQGEVDLFFDVAVGLANHKSLDPADLVARAKKMTDKQINVAVDLLKNQKWDLFATVMLGSDRIQHMLWRHFDASHRRFIKNSPHANAIKEYYQYLDEKLGELLALVPKDATVIVASDHGMVKQEGKININRWLMQQGYLVLNNTVDVTSRFKESFVDKERSVAWGGGAYNARVFINKAKVGDQWNALAQEIAQKLKEIPDDQGKTLDTKVYFAQDIYADTSSPQCPDLTVYFDDLRWASNPDLNQEGLYSWHTAVGADSCGHSRQGLFVIAGPNIAAQGRLQDIDIRQIAPTILQQLHVAIPDTIKVLPIGNLEQVPNVAAWHTDTNRTVEYWKNRFKNEPVPEVALDVARTMGKHAPLFTEVFPFLVKAFGGQLRRDGVTPLVSHSIILTKLLFDCGQKDSSQLLTTALHDVLEDTSLTTQDLARQPFMQQKEAVLLDLQRLTENIGLPREPTGTSLPARYREHISRLIGGSTALINTEILDRYYDLTDLAYLQTLPTQDLQRRVQAKLLKVCSYVDNIIENREDYNSQALEIFRRQVREVELTYGLTASTEKVVPAVLADKPQTKLEDIQNKMQTYFPESTLIDTIDGFQCKSYACQHPPGYIIVKPKYIPAKAIVGDGLKYRFLFEQRMVRFNLFAQKEKLQDYLTQFKKKYPNYVYNSPLHNNWFFVVPRNKIKKIHDGRAGLQELLTVPKRDLDEYLTLVRELINFLTASGVPTSDLGITHSTLLGNYTYGRSDIDVIIYGKENGWKILQYLKHATHPLLKWKTPEEWKVYYQEHKTAENAHFTEEEYVRHMHRKKYEGTFGGTVFTLFTSENPEETWFTWGEATYTPLGIATVEGEVVDDYNSHVRPGYYGVGDVAFVEAPDGVDPKIPVQRIVTYSIPFVQQALKGERIKACGLLELVQPKQGPKYYRIVVGYFDAYTNERREKEYIKSLG